MNLTRRKAQFARRRFFVIQLFKNFDRNGYRIIFKFMKTLRIVKKDIGVEDEYLCLVLYVFLFRQE